VQLAYAEHRHTEYTICDRRLPGTIESIKGFLVSQYFSLLVSFAAYWVKNPEKAAALWASLVQLYEAFTNGHALFADALGQPQPREAGISLTDEEQDAEERFNALAGTTRGPFGNGRIFRWLLNTPEVQGFRDKLQAILSGMGS
jgi:hypothetical protein